MSKPISICSPPGTAVESSGPERELVGVAVTLALPEERPRLAQMIIRSAMVRASRDEELEMGSIGHVFGAHFILFTVEVGDRKLGTKCLWKAVSNLEILGLSEIAFWDEAEAYWRTIHPQPAAPFARFLTPENIAAARIATESDAKVIDGVLEILRLKQSETGDCGNE